MGLRSIRCCLGPALLLWTASRCGGASEAPRQRQDQDGVPTAQFVATGVRPNVPPEAFEEEEPRTGESDRFIEQGCGDVPERIAEMDCDPFQPLDGCATGQGCQPYVQYPSSPCEPEVYGARCDWVGTGTQGESCSLYPCAAGYLCIATGQGTQCARICDLSVDSGCPPGLVCGSIDIEGIGTCF